MFPKYKNEELVQFRDRREKVLKKHKQQSQAQLPLTSPVASEESPAITVNDDLSTLAIMDDTADDALSPTSADGSTAELPPIQSLPVSATPLLSPSSNSESDAKDRQALISDPLPSLPPSVPSPVAASSSSSSSGLGLGLTPSTSQATDDDMVVPMIALDSKRNRSSQSNRVRAAGGIADRGLSDAECDQRRQTYSKCSHDAKAAEFEAELCRELQKVEAFYLEMEKTMARELAALKVPASTLHVSDPRTINQVKQGLISLFRRLHQLLNFRTINFLGLERLAEDFDGAARTQPEYSLYQRVLAPVMNSHIMASEIHSSTLANETIADIVASFAHIFEKGNQVRAKTKLTSRMTKSDYKVRDYVKLGLKLGMTLVLVFWALIEFIEWLLDPQSEDAHPVYIPVYQAFGMVICFLWLWGVDIWVWTKFRVNYVFIFEFNPRTRLTHLQVFQEAGTISVVFLTNLVIHFLHKNLGFPWPLSVYPLTVFIFFTWKLVFPWSPASHWESRRVLLRSLGNIVIAPFGRVTFRDIFLADCLTSMVKVFADLYFVACYYGTASFIEPNSASNSCSNGKWIAVPIISCLPLWWRFQQCMRRYFETRQAFPHLANAGKYALSHTVVIMAAFHTSFKGQWDAYRVIWLLLCLSSSSYSCWWDFRMDWGLLKHGIKGKYPLLRDQLMYPQPVYYIIMFLNMFMRFLWIFTILPFGENPFFTGAKWLPPIVIFTEIYRRCQWGILRTEWQHLCDEEKLRSTQHVPIILDESPGVKGRTLTRKDSKVVLEMTVMVVLLVLIGVAAAYL